MAKTIVLLVLCFLYQNIECKKVSPKLSTCEEALRPSLDYYCVLPNCDVPCPTKCLSRCNNLTFFTSSISDYFTSDTTFIFINGTHEHVQTFRVEGIVNLTFGSQTPEDNVIIQCSQEEVGFIFIECSNISIQNMFFFNCGQHFITPHHQPFRSALAFLGGSYLTLERVMVSDSIVQGLHVYGVQEFISVTSSSFIKAGYGINQTYYYRDSYIAGNSIFAEPKNDTTTDHSMPLEIIVDGSNFISNTNRPSCADGNYYKVKYCKCHHLASGLSIIIRRPNVNVSLTNLTLKDNQGCYGGNLAIIVNTSHPFTGNVVVDNIHIANGTATFGGGLYIFYLSAPEGYQDDYHCGPGHASDSDVITITNTLFEGNVALSGGGLYTKLTQSLAICNPIKISVSDNCTFQRNTLNHAGYGGVAFHSVTFTAFEYIKQILPQFLITINDCTFKEHYYPTNSKWNNSGSGVIYLKTNHHVMIKNIAIYGNQYSGIVIVDSNLIVSGSVEIYNNNGSSGGGMLFCSNAVMFLKPSAIMNISNNRAQHAGGGICVEDQCLQSKPMCFFQADYEATADPDKDKNIMINLIDNYAVYAGDQIYGGSIDFCYLMDSPFHNVSENEADSVPMYHQFFTIYPNEAYSVTSPQRRVCLCHDETNVRNCSDITFTQRSVFPGELFNLSVAVVGQLDGIVPGTVYAHLKSRENVSQGIPPDQEVQKARGKECVSLTYTIFTNCSRSVLSLGVQFVGDKSFAEHLPFFKSQDVFIDIKQCPIGFYLTKVKPDSDEKWKFIPYRCDCLPKLKLFFHCYIENKTIAPTNGNWIGYLENEYNTTHILYSIGCSLDYCKNTDPGYNESQGVIASENTTFPNQDNQCDFKRTGNVCGMCPKNYSVMLGSSQCTLGCSNISLLLIPLFAVMGILLVVLLMTLNMTVTEGTINGLLFYANVVQISNKVFFRGQNIPFLTQLFKGFIAWLNLDFGISVCLFRGMDDYAKAWLQFAFPLYIWLITGIIIYLSRRFTIVARLVNRNGIKVLATLVLLSYSKMLRASITAIHPKKLIHVDPNNTYENFTLCWYTDCNVQYMKGKHIPLGIFGGVSVICLLPFAFLLLFSDFLNKVRCFNCMWKLKPFLDTYTGPYTNEGRYWTGLLLVIRCGLFAASSFNYATRVTSLSITIASIVMIFLSIVPWLLQFGVYRKRWLNILECSFLLNLGVLTSGTQYLLHYDLSPEILTHVSIGIAFITFLFIILYHVSQFKTFQKIFFKIMETARKIMVKHFNKHSTMNESGITYSSTRSDSDEDLLSVSNFPPLTRFNQDREPLLNDKNN